MKSPRPRARKDAIRRLREAKGWGQQAFADRAVVSIKTINSVEQGHPAQLSTFGKIAKALGVEPAAFLEGHEPDSSLNKVAGDSRRVEIKLTLSIPFQDFDETEGLDRLSAFVMAVINGKNAITITNLEPSSVKLTMLVDEEDAPRLMQAFADHKLDAIQATELSIPRRVALLFVAAIVAQGSVNPIVVPVLPFAAFMLVMKRFQAAGIDVAFAGDDLITLKWTNDAGTSTADNIPTLASVNPSLIRHAIEVVTPEHLLPPFPCSITLRLEPNEHNGDSSAVLGERLESQLLECEPLRSKVSRVNPAPVWLGEVALDLSSVEDLRAMSEAVLTGFLGQPVTLVVNQKRKGTFAGGSFTMNAEVKTNLSASVWDTVAQELSDIGKLQH